MDLRFEQIELSEVSY